MLEIFGSKMYKRVAVTFISAFVLSSLAKSPLNAAPREFVLHSHPNARWKIVEDNLPSTSLTVQSLVLSSSLIARVRPLTVLEELNRGAMLYQYKLVEVVAVEKHLFGPDSQIRIGDRVVVTDSVDADRHEFMDDLALLPTDDSVVFLQRLPKMFWFSGKSYPAYRFTAPFVSKFFVEHNGRLKAMSIRETSASRSLRNVRASDILLAATGFSDERAAMATLLRRRFGRSDMSTAESFERDITIKPWDIVKRFAIIDSMHK